LHVLRYQEHAVSKGAFLPKRRLKKPDKFEIYYA